MSNTNKDSDGNEVPIETFRSEQARLETFTDWPVPEIVTPDELAAAGLYYTKQNDEVKCAFCMEVISNWKSGDQAINKHLSQNINCRFIQGLPVGDIPRPPQPEFKNEKVRLGTYTDWPVHYIVTPDELAAAGFYYTQRGDLVICAFCSAGVYNWEPGDKPIEAHMSCNPYCGFIQRSPVDDIPPPSPSKSIYKSEQERIKSFTNWHNSVSPEDLAEAGFYQTQRNNKVECAFCSLIIFNWRSSESVIDIHKSLNPNCLFIKGLPAGDIPIQKRKYRSYEVRLKTFSSWNPQRGLSSANVKLEDLVGAGFYYTQRGDQITCAYCSMSTYNLGSIETLCNRYMQNRQLREHLNCNPNCPYIKIALVAWKCFISESKYLREEERLETFIDWPKPQIVKPEDLAAAGFFYLNQSDKVKCAFCPCIFDNWQPGCKAMRRHKLGNPNCHFIQGLPSGDIPNPPHAKYKCEKVRLDTFIDWPSTDIVKPVDLAAAGFYYTQRGYLVICAFCSASAYQWKSEETAMDKHRYCNPYCSFIQGKMVGNIPHPPQTAYKCEKARLETFTGWPVPDIVTPQDLAAAGFFYTKRGSLVRCAFCFANIKGWKRGNRPMEEHRAFNPNCRFILGFPVGNIPLPPQMNYKFEKSRLETFENWPVPEIVTPDELAAAGFYYTKKKDEIKCAFCLDVFCNWVPGDKAISKHLSLNQNCRFIQGLPDGDVPRKTKTKYKSEEVRLQTFTNWPVPDIVTPKDLAAAGFYYTQRGDLVVCAFCSAAVCEWEHGDKVLYKHISCNPNCSIIQEKYLRDMTSPPQTVDNEHQFGSKIYNQQDIDMLKATIYTLQRENKKLKDARQCKICKDADINTVILPCRHLVVCESCSKNLTNCPICSGVVQQQQDIDMLANVIDNLERENRELKDAHQCKICMNADINTVILPCGHLVICVSCADSLTNCPTCRVDIHTTVQTYLQ